MFEETVKWQSRFKYTVGKKLDGEEKDRSIQEVINIAGWLETYGGALRITLWQMGYPV